MNEPTETINRIELTDERFRELYMNQLEHCSRICRSATEYYSDSVTDDLTSVLEITKTIHRLYMNNETERFQSILNGESDDNFFINYVTEGICPEILDLKSYATSESAFDGLSANNIF